MNNNERLARLLKIADRRKILVVFTDIAAERSWHGLYQNIPGLGTAIAVRSNLSLEMCVWVLAHELGHDFNGGQLPLFSPYVLPTPSTTKPFDPEEERANQTALNLLTNPEEWAECEEKHPTSLKLIARAMNLPIEAAVTRERISRSSAAATATASFILPTRLWSEMETWTAGQGGAQHTFGQLLRNRNGQRTTISRSTFSLLRQRAATMRGGFGSRAARVMDALADQIEAHGGMAAIFSKEGKNHLWPSLQLFPLAPPSRPKHPVSPLW